MGVDAFACRLNGMPSQEAHTKALAYSHLVLQKIYPAYVSSLRSTMIRSRLLIFGIRDTVKDGRHSPRNNVNPPSLASQHIHLWLHRRSLARL